MSSSPTYRLYRWHDPQVLSVALVSMAAGFGQYGAVAALGSVARAFGHLTHGATFADEAGLSGTVLGVGLAVLRLASLGSLPLASLADRFGRRPVLLVTCSVGLVFTIAAAASPGYWWFVVIFALGRPLLSSTNGVASVAVVELTASDQRAWAVALVAGGYGVGAGLIAIVHSLLGGILGFRGVFALAAVPLACLPLVRRFLVEPDRYTTLSVDEHRPPVLGPVGPEFRSRLVVVMVLAFAVSVITGPANSLVFIYAQNVRHLSGGVISLMVVAAGFIGLGGLLLGRWLADRIGRRPSVALAMVAMALAASLAYSGTDWGLILGYMGGVTAGSLFAPAAGTLANELFPTSVRASVTGWNIAAGVLGAVVGLVVFGALADVSGVSNHASFAALVTFLPMIPVAAVLFFLPETKGREPEELWGTAA